MKPAMNGSERIAVVGAGYFAAFHLKGWRACGAEVVALCDIDQQRCQSLAERFGISRTFRDATQMLDD